jgi:hypothetical protein
LKLLSEPSGSRHRLAWMVGAFALVSCALLGIVARAHASETIYWDNFEAPTTIGFANIDGTGGGLLNTEAVEIDSPEGLAYDPHNGRIYVANSENEQIDWVAIDGSGSGVLDTTGAKVEDPEGIAVDPATDTVYWANDENEGSIGYASANGGAGGLLNTTGVTSMEGPRKIALDTANGRVYWVCEDVVNYANLDNSGGGTINYAPGTGPDEWSAINVDPVAGRIYILGKSHAGVQGIYWVNTSGVGGGEVALSATPTETPDTYEEPFGLAFDPSNGRFLWANFHAGEDATHAFGTANLDAVGSSLIGLASVPVHGPQDPLIVKSPSGTGAPQVTGSGTALSCSQGTWSRDYPGSYVYGAPVSYSYQWSKDGQAIAGATGSSLTATASGSYTCTVTGTNPSGSASQTSTGYTIAPSAPTTTTTTTPTPAPTTTPTPASFSLASASKKKSKKTKVAAGKAAMLSLILKNVGGTTSSSSKVCVKLTKKAKKDLRARKCVAVGALAPGAAKRVKLRVKTKRGAKGKYKFSVVAGGASGSAILAQQITVTPKKHGKKKNGKK